MTGNGSVAGSINRGRLSAAARTLARAGIGETVVAALPRTIVVSALVALMVLLGCGRVARVDVADAPTPTPKAGTILEKRRATLAQTDMLAWQRPSRLRRDPATIPQAPEVPQKPPEEEAMPAKPAKLPSEAGSMRPQVMQASATPQDAETPLVETVTTHPEPAARPPVAAQAPATLREAETSLVETVTTHPEPERMPPQVAKGAATLREADLPPAGTPKSAPPKTQTKPAAAAETVSEAPAKPQRHDTSLVETVTRPGEARVPAPSWSTEPPAPKTAPAVKSLESESLVSAVAGESSASTSLVSPTSEGTRESPATAQPPASVTFVSTPPGATVVVSGRELHGKTPLGDRPVPTGPSRVEFRLDGHEPLAVRRRWEPGEVDQVQVSLRPIPARLTVTSTPPGATVWLNGRRLIEQTPIQDLSVPPGPGQVEVFLRKYEPAVVERTWKPDTADRVHVKLLRPSARVTFVSAPPGATVLVNGRALPGTTPMRDVEIRPGASTIEFRMDGHGPVVAERDWEPDAVDRVAVRLQPLWVSVSFVSVPPGATVKINGNVFPDKTPIQDASVRPGRSTVEFELDDHETAILERDWHPGVADRVEATLLPLVGRVRFETPKAWEELKIDGQAAAIGPKEWRELMPGRHSAQARSGDEVAHAEFAVLAERDTVIRLKWRLGKPNSDRYVFLPAARVPLGLKDYAKENPPRTMEMPAFWMSRTEVTVAEYQACVESGACGQPKSGENCNWGLSGRDQHPVNCISSKQAEAYAVWLSDRDGLPYELPTADQWERAARGDTGRRYPWGNDPPSGQCNSCDSSCPFNHFKDRSFDDGWELTAPAGSLEGCAGPEGILDLVGNVAEWCRDEKPGGGYGVRGGSWGQIGAFLDPSFPGERRAAAGDQTIGFRLVVPHIPGF